MQNNIFYAGISQNDDAQTEDKIPVVNFRTGAVHLTFDIIAYPAPRLLEVHRLLSNASSVGQRAKENLVSVTCDHRSVASPNVTCNLTVDNVTSTDAGFYRASLGNGFGFLHFAFEIQVNGKPCTQAANYNVCDDVGTTRSVVKSLERQCPRFGSSVA